MKLKLDLHDIYNRGEEIERALRAIIDEAVAKKAPLVEIIPGKGSGQLKKAGPAFPRPPGHQGALPPCREGLRQLRPRVHPLPTEVTGIRAVDQRAARLEAVRFARGSIGIRWRYPSWSRRRVR
jgi:hypothetical protein